MGVFEHFPYTNFHDLNLNWIIGLIKSLDERTDSLESWESIHQDEYEVLAEKVEGLINNLVDVIAPWDSSREYHVFSIVEYQGTNYIAVQDVPVGAMITDTNYWQPANTVIQQINAMGVVVSELQGKELTYDPDDYPGTDAQKVQAAIDAVANLDSGVVVLRRLYDLDDNVIFKTHSLRKTLRVIGISNNAGFKMNGYYFDGDAAAAGGIFFSNVYFTGSTDKIFYVNENLIRLNFVNCFFYDNNDIFSGTYAQQIRMESCRCSYFDTLFRTTGNYGCLSCSVIGCDLEDGSHIYINESGKSDSNLIITNCCIESYDGVLIQYLVSENEPHNIVFTNNYIEFVDADYIIDLTNAGANASSVFTICDNYFREAAGRTGTALVYINGNGFSNAIITMNSNQCIPAHSAVILALPGRTGVLRFLTRDRNIGQWNDPNNCLPIHNYTNIAGRNYISVMAPFSENGDIAIVPVQIRDYNTFTVAAVRTAYASGDLDATKFTITRMDEDNIQVNCSQTSLAAGKNLIVVFKATH